MLVKLKNLKRWALLTYTLISIVITGLFAYFQGTYYHLDWNRYQNDIVYYDKMSKIIPMGLFRLNGNLTRLNSPLLICVFAIGIIVCLALFLTNWKTYYKRTFTPLLSLFGFSLPLVFHNGGNILWMIFYGLILALIGSIFFILAMGKPQTSF